MKEETAKEETKEETKVETNESGKPMIERVGKILNEDGEWVEYKEYDDPDRPPIAFDYMGTPGLPISPDDEVVDFCM